MASPELLLQSFTAKDEIEAAFPILHDRRLGAVVMAWNRIDVIWNAPLRIDGGHTMSDNLLWETLWEFVEFDREDLAVASGLTVIEAMQKLQRAKMLYLVYPDGSVSDGAIQFLRTLVIAELNKATKGMDSPKSSSQPELPPSTDGDV